MMAQFSTGLLTGLAIGVALGGGGVAAIQAAQADPWTATGGEWHRLPDQSLAGALPQTFSTPAKAWDYGAATRAIAPLAGAPAIVRVDVADVTGSVGVSLAKPDGSALISKEAKAPQGAGPFHLYFRAPGGQPTGVLLRNPGADGQAGSATVRSVSYVLQSKLPQRLQSDVNKAGLN